MVDSMDQFGNVPFGDSPFQDSFRAECPSCGEEMHFEIIIDLYRRKCRSCGKIPILYFWGKEKGPHLTEDIAYMLYQEGLLTDENLENALQTKKQSGKMPFIELLLSIQYVTSEDLEVLAAELVPEDWMKGITQSGEPSSSESPTRKEEPLSRHELDAVYMLIDQIVSGYGYPFTRMRSPDLELILRSLGADLTAGEIRTRMGKLLLDPRLFPEKITEREFSETFCKTFELNFADSIEGREAREAAGEITRELAIANFIAPVSIDDEILEVGIPGHLIAMGFAHLFNLTKPGEIRQKLKKPISFVVVPLETILNIHAKTYDHKPDLDVDRVNELLQNVKMEIQSELSSRYPSQSNGEELNKKASDFGLTPIERIRKIFSSGSMEGMKPEGAPSPVHPNTINTWIYHPESSRIIPDVLTRDDLDQLSIWVENQYRKPEQDPQMIPEIPESERKDCTFIHRACKQLQEHEKVNPESLGLSEDVFSLMSSTVAGVYRAIPIASAGGYLWIALENTEDKQRLNEISFLTGSPVKAFPGNREGIYEVLVRAYGLKTFAYTPESAGIDVDSYLEAEEIEIPEELEGDLKEVLPGKIARELHVVPVQILPDTILFAADRSPNFVTRKLIEAFVQKNIEVKVVDHEEVDRLLERLYGDLVIADDATPEKTNGKSPNGNSPGGLEIETETLDLEDIEEARQLIDQLNEAKADAPVVEILTDHPTILEDEAITLENGELTVIADFVNMFDDDEEIWPPGMSRLFPALPVREEDGRLYLVSSHIERRWFLDSLGLFTGKPCVVYILPENSIKKLSHHLKPDLRDALSSFDTGDSSLPVPGQYSDVYGSFREMAGARELRRFLLLLFFGLFEGGDSLNIVIKDSVANILPENSDSKLPGMELEGGYVYGLHYAMLQMCGIENPDFYGDQSGSVQLYYRGKIRTLDVKKSRDENGQTISVTLID